MIWNRYFYIRKDDCILIRINNFSTAFFIISSHELLWLVRIIDCLIELLNVPLVNVAYIWRCHYYRWRLSKFKPLCGTRGLEAWLDLDRNTWPRLLWQRTSVFVISSKETTGEDAALKYRIYWSQEYWLVYRIHWISLLLITGILVGLQNTLNIAIIDHRNISWFTEYIKYRNYWSQEY